MPFRIQRITRWQRVYPTYTGQDADDPDKSGPTTLAEDRKRIQ